MQASRTICQVLAGAETGGLERHFADLCNALAEHHHVIAVAHSMHAGAFSKAVQFIPLDLARGRYHPVALLGLYRVLRGAMPDLVHAHANKATAMVSFLKPLLPMPFVATLHNRKSNTSMFRKCDAVIAVSRTLAECLPGREVVVIPNGIAPAVPVDDGRRQSLAEAGGGKMLVLAAGRLVAAKGFDVLLRAWKPVSATLWIAGEGPRRVELEMLIEQLDLGDRVRLLGHRQDLDALMERADLLVLPSRSEGFPYVLLEALQRRLPVVASRVPGAVDVLPQRWLVPVDEEQALAETVQRALSGLDAMQDEYGPVWEMAARELTLETMVARTEDVYRTVLNG